MCALNPLDVYFKHQVSLANASTHFDGNCVASGIFGD